jgi:hypothetical protein
MLDTQYVQALEAERAMHIAAGNTERAAEVTAELERVTGKRPAPATEPATEPTQTTTRPRAKKEGKSNE